MLTLNNYGWYVEVTGGSASHRSPIGAQPSNATPGFLSGILLKSERERVRFRDVHEARQVLLDLRFRHRVPAARALLARHLSPGAVSRLSDAEVLEEIARRLSVGSFAAFRSRIAQRAYSANMRGDEAQAAPIEPEEIEEIVAWSEGDPHAFESAEPLTEAETPFEDAEPWEDAESDDHGLAFDVEPTTPPPAAHELESLDAARQAAALRSAAAAGVPFCEECEKERLRLAQESRRAPAAPSETAHLDAPAQAEALREAAASGAPFCAECEKAKQRAASGAASGAASAPADGKPAAEIAKLDAPTQASTMRSAAAEGAPFCEECERARKAAR